MSDQFSRPSSQGQIYLISDRRAVGERDLAQVVAALLSSLPIGAALLQLREKDLGPRDVIALARRLLPITRPRRCPLLINDRLDVALAAGADGVHLPERGLDVAEARAIAGPSIVIGTSVHSPAAAGARARAGADAIVCGPIWPTPSKAPYGAPLGIEALSAAVAAVAGTGAALFAIGGVERPSRAALARSRGAHGIAGIRAFFASCDPARSARAMYQALETSLE